MLSYCIHKYTKRYIPTSGMCSPVMHTYLLPYIWGSWHSRLPQNHCQSLVHCTRHLLSPGFRSYNMYTFFLQLAYKCRDILELEYLTITYRFTASTGTFNFIDNCCLQFLEGFLCHRLMLINWMLLYIARIFRNALEKINSFWDMMTKSKIRIFLFQQIT